jgi:hypothetical protein
MFPRLLTHSMRSATVLATVIVAVACGEPSQPRPLPLPYHPLAGTYTVEATLTHFYWETVGFGSTVVPGCVNAGGQIICEHLTSFVGASLIGDLVVDGAGGDSLLVSGPFRGSFCTTIGTAGCTAISATPVQSYSLVRPLRVSGDSAFSLSLYGPAPADPLQGSRLTLTNVRADGDSLFGSVRWSLQNGRSPPAHLGTFVARR